MKKSIAAAVIIFIFAVAGVIYSVTAVWGQKEQVIISHTTLAGDMEAAKGISFQLKNQWSNRLFWDTFVTIDEEMIEASKEGSSHVIKSKTDFHTDWSYTGTHKFRYTVYSHEDVELYYANGGEHWSTSLDSGISMMEFNDNYQMDFKKAIAEVAYKTKPGEQYSETITLADYERYYPLQLQIYVQMKESDSSWYVCEKRADDYLGITIPRDHLLQVTVRKNEADRLVEYRTETIGGGISFEPCSVSIGNKVYFAFYGKDEKGVPVDLETKAGNGIYQVYTSVSDAGHGTQSAKATIDYENMNVFALPEKDCYPLEMQTDGDGNLLLFTKEAGKLMLRVIEPDTMQELQKLDLMDSMEHVEYRQAYRYGDNLMVLQENGGISFVTKEKEGYQVLITGSLGDISTVPAHYDWNYAMDYTDGRLALIFTEEYYLCSAYVYVFSSEGLEYQGYFKHSADAMERMHGPYDRIAPLWEDSLTISF